jgi:hypothetical protein
MGDLVERVEAGGRAVTLQESSAVPAARMAAVAPVEVLAGFQAEVGLGGAMVDRLVARACGGEAGASRGGRRAGGEGRGAARVGGGGAGTVQQEAAAGAEAGLARERVAASAVEATARVPAEGVLAQAEERLETGAEVGARLGAGVEVALEGAAPERHLLLVALP